MSAQRSHSNTLWLRTHRGGPARSRRWRPAGSRSLHARTAGLRPGRAAGFAPNRPQQRRPERERATDHDLRQLAEQYGVETSYVDMAGRRQEASAETLRQIIGLLGPSVGTFRQLKEALKDQEQQYWRRLLPPVAVCWDEKPFKVPVHLPADAQTARAFCKLHLEDGRCQCLDWQPERFRRTDSAEVQSRTYFAAELVLAGLPAGYHKLELELANRLHQTLIISAPTHSYSAKVSGRKWGLFLPLYANHSQSSWGAGNLADWEALGRWAATVGARMMGTLPLLAAFLDDPGYDPSPYSPISRLFWNEFWVELERVPEFAGCPAAQKLVRSHEFQHRLESFRRAPLIDYRAQMAARREVLELLANYFFSKRPERRQKFENFLRDRPALRDYAQFRAAREQTGTSWQQWEQRLRYGKLQPGDYAQSNCDYHLYAQWIADEQMGGISKRGRQKGIEFYFDLPIGVHPDGYDMWRHRDAFACDVRTGTPPDLYFPKGQNWGFAPLHPRRLRESGYQYLIHSLRFQMRHSEWLRLDHVAGLHRLFWIPPGAPPSLGAYVRYPAEELYAILCLESVRHQTVIVGENLGTVPPAVTKSMQHHHLRQTYVLQYEQSSNSKRALRPPPALAVASLNTHDLPPFAAHWRGLDITDRAQLRLCPPENVTPETKERRASNSALVAFLRRNNRLGQADIDGPTVLRACLEWLARSPAEVVLVSLEDLWQEERWQNVPGTSTQQPNWRRKARFCLEKLQQLPELAKLLRAIDKIRKRRMSA